MEFYQVKVDEGGSVTHKKYVKENVNKILWLM